MTGLLASVRSAAEAALAVTAGADIVDAKEPSAGALGRVDPAILRAIVREVAGRCPVSATIGDLDLSPDRVSEAVESASADGADIVKIGVFPGALEATWAALCPLTRRGLRIVAVMFADCAPDLVKLSARSAEAKFFGVMLDTADKASGPLMAHLDRQALAAFVDGEQLHRFVLRANEGFVQRDLLLHTAAFVGVMVPGMINQNPAHGLCEHT